jgi:hypothetical protein
MFCLYPSTAYLVIAIVAGGMIYYFEVNICYPVVYLAFCCYYGLDWGWDSAVGILTDFFL